jgi:hypothetical protein
VSFFILGVAVNSIKKIYSFRRKFKSSSSSEPTLSPSRGLYLFLSFLGYGGVFLSVIISFHLTPAFQYAFLKILGGLAGVGAMLGVGKELRFYLDNKQTGLNCFFKISSHCCLLLGIFWVIYRFMPLTGVVLLPAAS